MPKPTVPHIPDDGTIHPIVRKAIMALREQSNAMTRKGRFVRQAGSYRWDIALVAADIPDEITRDTELTAAIAGLSSVYQPLDGDLTAIAALATTTFGRSLLTLAGTAALTADIDLFTSLLSGAVPASGGGTTNYLRADGAWASPPSGTIADGDYGDISITGGVWSVDDQAVSGAELAMSDVTTNNVTSTKHGFVPKSPADATQFLNGAATPAFAAVKDSDLSTSDITTNNSSTSKHGFLKKLDNDATHFMDGTGAWSAPAGSGATDVQLRSTRYKTFTTGTDAYEFNGSDLGNFAAVNSGSHTVVVTEDNDMISLAHPGGDASAELHAWMKTCTWNTNDYIEAWVGVISKPNAALSVGLIASDGHTYNSGNQVFFGYFNTLSTGLATHTKFNTAGTSTNNNINNQFTNGLGLRLQYLGSNQWAGFVSLDGENWLNVTGTLTKTLTPTEYGFFVSTWGSSNPAVFTFWYVRKGS